MAGPAPGAENMSRESTVVGSENGLRMRYATDQGEDGAINATETTGLLGARTSEDGGQQTSAGEGASWNIMADFEGMPWWRTPSVYWLIGPYALFTLAFGGSMVPKLNLMVELICQRHFSEEASRNPDFTFLPVTPGEDNPQCEQPEVQRIVSTFILATSVITGMLSAFSAPRLGALSDRLGRKPIMAISSAGGLAGEVTFILAASFPDVVHYRWLIAAAVVDGICGSFTVGSIMSHSYTSDCTPPSKRAVSIGYMHACLFTGMAAGPLLAGYFVEWTGSLLSIFFVTLGCHVVFILYILFILPESVSKRRRAQAREKHAKKQEQEAREEAFATEYHSESRLHGIKKVFRMVRRSNPFGPLAVLTPPGTGLKKLRRNLVVLAVIDTVLLSAAMSSGSVTLLYTKLVFHWHNFETSAYMSLLATVRVVVLMGIFPIINHVFRTRKLQKQRRISGVDPVERTTGADEVDVWLIRSAILSDVMGATGYVFARRPAVFVMSGIITAFGGLGSATIQSSLTKHVPAERVGELLGAIGLLHAISRIFAPIIFNGMYAATVGSFPQATFVLVTATFGLLLVLSFLIRPHVYMTEADESAPPRLATQARPEDLEDDEIVPYIS